MLFSIALSNVVAQETRKRKSGVIDRNGNIIFISQYDKIHDYHDGLAVVQVDVNFDHIDAEERWHYMDVHYGVIDKNGKEVVPINKYFTVSDYREGMAAVAYGVYEMGFIDKTGKEVVPRRCYGEVRSFSEGMAAVQNHRDKNNSNRWGFIDKTGKEVVPPSYHVVRDFSEGMAAVRYDTIIKVIREGKVTFRHDDKWGFIDKTGKEVVPPRYDEVKNFSEGLAQVSLGGKEGFIDRTGKVVVPPRYDNARNFSEGMAAVKIDRKWGYINKAGKEVIPPYYDEVRDFSEGLAQVSLGGKEGFIDRTGNVVVPLIYHFTQPFFNGVALVCTDEECTGGYSPIDKTGKQIFSPKHDYRLLSPFNEGVAFVGVEDDNGYSFKVGLIDKTGTMLVPFIYDGTPADYIDGFREGLAAVYKYESNESGFIDKTGNVVIPFRKYGATPFSEGLAVVYVNSEDIVLFEEKNKLVQETWHECNQQLVEYPYNVEKLQLDPVSITNFFLDPRLDAITDSIVSDLKQKSSELLVECYNNLKTKKPKVFSEIYLEQHPETKSVLENLKLECRCNNYSETDLVVKIADNVIPECTCRNDYWNQYGTLFSSRSEFNNTYNTSEQGFLEDVKLRQSLRSDIQDITSMLAGLKTAKFKDGLTGKNESIIQILQKVQYHKRKYYYDEVVEMMFAADAAMEKEWEKNGSLFSSRNEFYEAYVSGEYKNVLKEKKGK